MKLAWIIFALLLTMCGAVGVVLLTPEPTVVLEPGGEPVIASHGVAHPTVSTMLHGGDGVMRYQPIRIATWVFALGMITFFTSLLMFACRKRERVGRIAWLLLVVFSLHLASMIGMLVSYEAYLHDPDPALYAAFPAPTAWMMYVLWPMPLLFVLLFVVGFDRWIYRPEDEQAIAELMRRCQSDQGGA